MDLREEDSVSIVDESDTSGKVSEPEQDHLHLVLSLLPVNRQARPREAAYSALMQG